MIKETKNFNNIFWEYNYPVQLWRNEQGETNYVIYMPRKETCYYSDEPVLKDELDIFIDNAIEKLKTGIKLLKMYKKGDIDKVYYWDEN